ncbi:PREDICTED: ubiquitin-like-specific protease ESD4 [Fragaria vesca subsp. vesca]|uniref:ubiquitin-like-specific protease ESD4 n=1 Tax=Fragaria vesca subsp. vesca TaxID=101020 RepID=UPI0002C340BD|nr:PREDICTED: ubiquitin-like-specific protease ESD4 [Fragaria vesca subsp. vesca]
MGALARNRTRIDECLTSNCTQPSPFSPNSRISKRPRLFSSFSSSSPPTQTPTRPVSNSAVARVSRYPAAQPLRRVLAPCPGKFSSSLSRVVYAPEEHYSGDDEAMGNVLDRNLLSRYNNAKKEALATILSRNKEKEKEVIRLDEEEDEQQNRVSDDSSIEEVVDLGEDDEPDVQELERKTAVVKQQPSASSVASDFTTLTMNGSSLRVEESAEKMRELLSLDPEDLPRYKKMIEELERQRAPKLKQLGFEIQVTESKRALFESLRPKKKPVEEAPLEPFIPLKEEEKAVVDRAFSPANRRKILVTHENSNIQITGELLQCLRPCAWLNDEVINVYLELLKEREKRDPKKFLKCHFFNTFFYKKLIGGRSGYDYKAVRRWTTQRKLGYSLIDCDKIFVPIHKEIHWCLAVINKADQKFQYLDSLRGRDTKVMQLLAKYYVDEVKDKSGKDIDVSSWKFECIEDLPEQENGFDCGVFMIKYADFYSRGLDLCFHQKHMPYFRLRTAKEVLQLRAD